MFVYDDTCSTSRQCLHPNIDGVRCYAKLHTTMAVFDLKPTPPQKKKKELRCNSFFFLAQFRHRVLRMIYPWLILRLDLQDTF